MTYLPLFPLNIVAYPGENVNLHIFEPRYRQLIGECLSEGKTFGLPVVIGNQLVGYGTEMEVLELVKQYEDGRMDIRVRGIRAFKVLSFDPTVTDKLYAGGEIEFCPDPEIHPPVLPALEECVQQLYDLLKAELKADPTKPQPYSYQLGHAVGLPLEGEYELLTIDKEFERQEFLLSHLRAAIPVVENMERTKDRIRMNGDFRKFNSPEL